MRARARSKCARRLRATDQCVPEVRPVLGVGLLLLRRVHDNPGVQVLLRIAGFGFLYGPAVHAHRSAVEFK